LHGDDAHALGARHDGFGARTVEIDRGVVDDIESLREWATQALRTEE
jgi:hypothetical protein